MKAIFICVCALISSASPTMAEQQYNVGELIELALKRSPELKALTLETDAAAYSAAQASRWSNPNLEVAGERKTEPAGDTQLTRIELSQMIDMPGRIGAREKAASARKEIARIDKTLSEVELRFAILRLIYEYKVANEKADHAKERLDRFKTIGTFLRSRVFASPQKRAEASIVRAKLMMLGRELREMEAKRRIAWHRLNLYLGFKSEPAIQVKWFSSAPQIDLTALTLAAEQNGPDVLRQAQRVKESESELSLAKYEAWPGFVLAGSYANGSGISPEKVYGLGISFPLPLFSANRSGIHAQENRVSAEKERHTWSLENTRQKISSAIEHYKATLASVLELRIEEIPKLEKDMISIDLGFRKGQVDLLTYIEADGEHFESLNAIFDTQIDFIEAQAALYLLAGQSPARLE